MEPGARPVYCKACDYSLAGMGGGVCPECGRAFDPAEPGSFSSSPGRLRRRRWIRRGAIAILAGVLLVVLVPRGYVACTVKVQGRSGLLRTVEHVRLIAPGWFPARYPGWTSERDESAGDPERRRSDPFMLDVAVRKRWFDWKGGTRSGGGATAGATCVEGHPMTINGVVVTRESTPAIAARIGREIASRDDFGIELRPADLASREKAPSVKSR